MSNSEAHAAAQFLGRLGGLKGGPARAAALSPEERKEVATRASRAAAEARTKRALARRRRQEKREAAKEAKQAARDAVLQGPRVAPAT